MSDIQSVELEEDSLENQENEENDVTEELDLTMDTEEDAPETESEGDEFFGIWDGKVEVNRIKMLLYGVSGSGKTTMAASFPKPIFLDLEGGMLSTRRVGSVMRYPKDPKEDIKNYAQVVEFFNLVRSVKNPPFETVVIDSLNELQLLVTQHVVSKFSGVKRQYDDQMTLADYGKANRDFSKVIRLFLKLPFHIVFTVGSLQREGGETDLQLAPKFVGKQVGPDVQRMMDMIGYCHTKRIGDRSEHYVSFHMTPEYLAKDRLGIAVRDIPNNFEALMSFSKGKK